MGKDQEKRQVPPALQKLLKADVYVTNSLCTFMEKFLPFRSLKVHYKMLEVSRSMYLYSLKYENKVVFLEKTTDLIEEVESWEVYILNLLGYRCHVLRTSGFLPGSLLYGSCGRKVGWKCKWTFLSVRWSQYLTCYEFLTW